MRVSECSRRSATGRRSECSGCGGGGEGSVKVVN
jgi:hypothetical protein